MSKIGIIIVLYNSEKENYKELLSNEIDFIIILIDNTPNRDLRINDKSISYIPLNQNYGIAYAQNVGIETAKELKCNYVIFFDQDSKIEKKYPLAILNEYIKLENKIDNFPILGPSIINEKTNKKYKENNNRLNEEFYEVNSIISSGSIVSIEIFDKIGLMDSSLFIDYVDFEFCWRALSLNCKIYRSKNIILKHNVGEKFQKFCGFPIIESSPFRYLYQYRNYLWLCKRSYVPIEWKYKNFIRKCFLIIFYCFNGRKDILKNIFKGIKLGIKS